VGDTIEQKLDLTVAVQFDGSWLIIIIIKPINEEKI
jgi:hypothetical protein